MPVRRPSGDIKKAGEYMNLELREDLGWRYKSERPSCVMMFKVIYKRTNLKKDFTDMITVRPSVV